MRIERFEWDGQDPAALAAELRALQTPPGEMAEDVAAIIATVAERGDEAVLEFDRRFSGASRSSPLVPREKVASAVEAINELSVVNALRFAARQIARVAEAEAAAEADTEVVGDAGQRIRMRSVPVGAAGAYVPGGSASYPSSALMCCIPAKAAGVERVVVASPPGPGGEPDQVVLAAASIGGADEVYATGGVQAIAALALGTESIQPVDVIVGPGNRYVQEAKRQLFGRVGVEGIAGPTELMAILGPGGDPAVVALDLCAQAEHGPDGLLVATAGDETTLDSLQAEIERIASAPESTVADAPFALVLAPGPEQAVELADALAPEHLELALEDAEGLADRVTAAGVVFVGPMGGAAFGDYTAGSNHVLPTGGAGRFTGPLGPRAFRRRIATVTVPQEGSLMLGPPLVTLAEAEGFPLHGESAMQRFPDADREDGR